MQPQGINHQGAAVKSRVAPPALDDAVISPIRNSRTGEITECFLLGGVELTEPVRFYFLPEWHCNGKHCVFLHFCTWKAKVE